MHQHRQKSQAIVSYQSDSLEEGRDSKVHWDSKVVHIGRVLSQHDVVQGKRGSDRCFDEFGVGPVSTGPSALRDNHGEVVDWGQRRKRKYSNCFLHCSVTLRDSYRPRMDIAAKGQDNELVPSRIPK